MSVILDASALLALLFQEPGADIVDRHLAGACISTVNLCEVLGRLARDGVPAGPLLDELARSSIVVVAFETAHAELAAAMVPHVRAHGLSLGDRACLALALARREPVLTADRVWLTVATAVDVEVRCIR